MASPKLDELCPSYVGEDRLDVAVDPAQVRIAALESVILTVSYERTLPYGVMLPLILEIQGSSPESYQQRIYRRRAPTSLIFTPREGGPHLVVLRELAHNRWHGKLRLNVEGGAIERRPLL